MPETDEDGILTLKEINKVLVRELLSPVQVVDGDPFYFIAAAQHQADIEAVKAIKNPYAESQTSERIAWESARQLILATLEMKHV